MKEVEVAVECEEISSSLGLSSSTELNLNHQACQSSRQQIFTSVEARIYAALVIIFITIKNWKRTRNMTKSPP